MRSQTSLLVVVVLGCGSSPPASPPSAAAPAAPAAPPAAAPAPVTAATAGSWLELPDLGRRIACADTPHKVIMSSSRGAMPLATVQCGKQMLSIARLPVDSMDAAVVEVEASLRALESTVDRRARTPTELRLEHHNRGGDGTNYWVDTVRVIADGYYLCQAGAMAGFGPTPPSAADAARGAAACATLE